MGDKSCGLIIATITGTETVMTDIMHMVDTMHMTDVMTI